MGGITFTKGQGGLNRKLPGEDHISSLVYYLNTYPTGFSVGAPIVLVNDLVSAEALGITSTNASVDIKIMHYHVSEFYRQNPGAALYIAVFPQPIGAHTFNDIPSVIDFAEGKIRKMGVYTQKAFDIAHIALLQTKATAAEAVKKMFSILYAADFTGITTAALVDLSAQTAPNVSVVVGQDGASLGKSLYTTAGKSVTCLGAALGALSRSKVSESIGWVEKFPMDAVELNVPALANGDLLKNLTDAVVNAVDAKRYIFLKKYIGDSRTYFNDSHTAVALTSDYAYIENEQTIDKAIREVYRKLLPTVNGPVPVDSQTGKLDAGYVVHLENLGDTALVDMERAGELSGYKTFVDPDQDILATSTISVAIVNVPVGVSRNFNVKVSFIKKIPQ